MKIPKVSIILPAYNAETTITEAINSVLNQTFIDFELIIINDGSTDATKDVINSIKDRRLLYFENEGNKGLIFTLNRGIDISRGKYIARMDADDICHPQRLEKQVSFMESNQDVIVCGTQINYLGTKHNKYRKLAFPIKDKKLKEMLAISTCFAHPTVIIRRDMLIKSGVKYNREYINAEDYSIWIDLMPYGKFANLPEAFLHYRISDTQISQPSNPITRKSVLKCHIKYLYHVLPSETITKILSEPISIRTIRILRKSIANPKVLEAFYLSLNHYNISALCYFVISGDIFKLGIAATLRFLKRYVWGKNPIYYNI